MKQILALTRKELEGYFGSLLAIIFLGTFLAVVLFTFFSVETFFARGLADVRPLFQWMPVLLIFLLAALTMRQWSEEQRSGTLEVLLTLPVRVFHLVIGKFLAVMTMILVALALTLPLPITISLIGNIDWGPVVGGYLAAILMASAYASIGLFVSSRTDNQIVSLIATVLVGGLFYLVGTPNVTDFVGGGASEILRAVGTGSRFESIERGVIDLRDLMYYLSVTGLFLMLNTISLDSIRWSRQQTPYRRSVLFTSSLIGLNLILVNVWMYPLYGLRLDMTAQKEYTISQTTRDLLTNLQEPLLIRGFVSENTHPLLTPLIPSIRDTLREYEIASGGMVIAEVVDPLSDPEIEAEANQTYGIRPTPFQVTGRHEASVINSYFDILVRYGDQSIVLNFQDLIEVTQTSGDIQVGLRNLEYDLTSAIKKVVYGFQSVDAILAALDSPVNMTFFVSQEILPTQLITAVETINTVGSEIQSNADGKFNYQMIDPDNPSSPVSRQTLIDTYGLQPFPVELFSADTYFFHLIIESEAEAQLIYPPADLTEAEVRTTIENAIKQISPGFLKTIGVWSPPQTPTQDAFGQMRQPISSYQLITEQLNQEYNVSPVDLSVGTVPANLDALVIVAPQYLGEAEMFAIDQFLMRGGAVIMAASNYKVDVDQFQGWLTLLPIETGLTALMEHYGVSLSNSLVLDPQNEPFPVTITRQVNDFQVQEVQAIDYPFFVDIRPDGMNLDSPIVSNLPAVTLNWPSPVEIDMEKNAGRETVVLLQSSPQSWLQDSANILPDLETYPELGFPQGIDAASYPLAVSIQGSFESYYSDKPAPPIGVTADPTVAQPPQDASQGAVITQSPDSAQLIVVGSATFIDDLVLQLSSRLSQDRYLNSLGLLQNTVDWSVEDLDLLAIRSRGSYTRVLIPLNERGRSLWEIANYVIALILLISIYTFWQIRKRNEKSIDLVIDSQHQSKHNQ